MKTIEIKNDNNMIFWEVDNDNLYYDDIVKLDGKSTIYIYQDGMGSYGVSAKGEYKLGVIADNSYRKNKQEQNKEIKCRIFVLRENIIFEKYTYQDGDTGRIDYLEVGGKALYYNSQNYGLNEKFIQVRFSFMIFNGAAFIFNKKLSKEISVEDLFKTQNSIIHKILWSTTVKETKKYLENIEGLLNFPTDCVSDTIKEQSNGLLKKYGIQIVDLIIKI